MNLMETALRVSSEECVAFFYKLANGETFKLFLFEDIKPISPFLKVVLTRVR